MKGLSLSGPTLETTEERLAKNLLFIYALWIPAYRQAGRILVFLILHYAQKGKSVPGSKQGLCYEVLSYVGPDITSSSRSLTFPYNLL